MPREVTKHVPHYKMKGPSIWDSLGWQNPFAPAPTPREQPRTLPKGWAEGPIPQDQKLARFQQMVQQNRGNMTPFERGASIPQQPTSVNNQGGNWLQKMGQGSLDSIKEKASPWMTMAGGVMNAGKGLWNKASAVSGIINPANSQVGRDKVRDNAAQRRQSLISGISDWFSGGESDEEIFAEEEERDPRDIANQERLDSIGGYRREAAPQINAFARNQAAGNRPKGGNGPARNPTGPAKAPEGQTPNARVSPFLSSRVQENNVFETGPDSRPGFEFDQGVENDAGSIVSGQEESYSSPAMDRYLDHINQIPERGNPSIWNRIGASLVGAFEGGRNGAGAGWQAGRAALNAPYEEAINQWGHKGQALREAANLESGSMNNYLKMMNTQSMINRREFQNENDSLRTQAYQSNAEQRARNVDLNRDRLHQQGFVQQVDGRTGEIIFIHKMTGEVMQTGITAMEYQRFQQQKNYQGGMLAARNRGLDQGKERIGQRWSTIEEGKRRWNFDNQEQ